MCQKYNKHNKVGYFNENCIFYSPQLLIGRSITKACQTPTLFHSAVRHATSTNACALQHADLQTLQIFFLAASKLNCFLPFDVFVFVAAVLDATKFVLCTLPLSRDAFATLCRDYNIVRCLTPLENHVWSKQLTKDFYCQLFSSLIFVAESLQT